MEGQSGLPELSIISWMSAVEGCPLSGVVYVCVLLVLILSQYFPYCLFSSKVTAPQDAHKQFSAAGSPWLKHFRIQ